MAELPGYKITVQRNGSEVQVSSGSITREAGQLGPSWEVELDNPVDTNRTDTWTIKRKLAGNEETLVSNARATMIGGTDGVDKATRRVSGDYGSADTNNLLEYCVPKILVFVNMEWIRSLVPDATIMNGILVYGSAYSSGVRIFHRRLPGKEVGDDDFQCIAGCNTHHTAARYLASLVGYQFQSNTPDMDILDTFTVQAGTKWRDAIEQNFKIWFRALKWWVIPLWCRTCAAEIRTRHRLSHSQMTQLNRLH